MAAAATTAAGADAGSSASGPAPAAPPPRRRSIPAPAAQAAAPTTAPTPTPTPKQQQEPPLILVVLDVLLGVWGSLFRGSWVAVRGLFLALRNPEVRRVHRQILLPLAAIAIPAYALLVLPARLLLAALRFGALAAALSRYSAATARLVPLAINLGLRFLFYTPLDRAYLAVLGDLDPALARRLGNTPARSYKEVLGREARRLLRLLSFLPLYVGLSLVPVVGRLLKWAFKVYTLSKVLPSRSITAAVALLSLLPFVDTPTTLLLQAYLAQVASMQELQLPYLGRLMRGTSRRQETAFVVGADPLASLAFAYALGLLIAVPYAGPLLCILAHAAAPLALVELMLDGKGASIVATADSDAATAAAAAATATAVVDDDQEVRGGKTKVG